MVDARPIIIRNGRLVDRASHKAEPVDILVRGDTIAEIGKGLAAPSDARVIDAQNRLLHPGLINAHTHGHSNFSNTPTATRIFPRAWAICGRSSCCSRRRPTSPATGCSRTSTCRPMSARSRCC